jgi:DNA repair protein RadC
MRITQWEAANRPRERLLGQGGSALSDAELLAIFLRTGIAGINAVELAQQLLAHFGGLNGLFSASQDEFCAHKGMGTAKFAALQAVIEMARRAILAPLRQQNALTSPGAVQQFLQLWLRHRPYEVFAVLFLNGQNQLLEARELFRGTVNQTAVYPREVVKLALQMNASAVILAHNHPSGCAEPSQADQILTKAIKQAMALVDIQVLDHLIVAANQHYSFAHHGLI